MAQEAGPVGAFPPPPGRVPNFEHPEDLGRTSLVIGLCVMAGVTTVMVGMRTYAKVVMRSPYYKEDWACLIAYALWIFYICTVLVMARYGEGYHEWEVTKDSYKEILRWLYIGSIMYCPAAYFTKMALLLLEARVFAVYERVPRGVFVFGIALLVCYIPILTLKSVVCIPVAAAWDSDIKPAQCMNQRKIFISDMCLGVFTDIVILILPIPLTFSLRMPLATKIKVVTLLSAGGIATGVSIYRLYKSVLFLNPSDRTEGFVALDLTTALELAIGIVCACLPTINLLVQRFMESRETPPNLARTANQVRPRKDGSGGSWSLATSKTAQIYFTMLAQKGGASPVLPTLQRTRSDDRWEYNPRATSHDGRREGWLRQANRGGTEQGMDVEAVVPMQSLGGQEARKSWEAAWSRGPPSENVVGPP